MNSFIKIVVILILLAGLGGGAYAGYLYLYKNRTDAVILQTAPVKRGDLLAVISATGRPFFDGCVSQGRR
jgi:hypothetical protein